MRILSFKITGTNEVGDEDIVCWCIEAGSKETLDYI